MENDEHLSDGSKTVMSILSSEPTVPRFKTIDPALADKLLDVLIDARQYTDEHMQWLSGVFLDFGQVSVIRNLIGKIQIALKKGEEYETDFWNGVQESRDARNGFVAVLLGGVEKGDIQFNDNKGENCRERC